MVFGKGKGKKSYSSKTLSRFGKLGGRPQKYSSNAERQRAKRLRKKQLEQGKTAQLRPYLSYEEKVVKSSFVRMICDKCRTKSIGGLRHLNRVCFSCYQGKNIEEVEIIKRAGTNTERSRRSRGIKGD
jgi:ribosomal protein L44E